MEKKMKLKVDETGNVALFEGKPVYIHEDGREIPFDAPQAMKKISELNGENKSRREQAEKAEALLKSFEGIEPDKAKTALETLKKIDAKTLIDAGEVDRVKLEATKAYEDQLKALKTQYDPIITERDTLRSKLVSERIGHAFSGSRFINDKLVIPAPMAQAAFGGNFRLENDVIVGYNADGSKIYSSERPGELAGFEEALTTLVNKYPYKDQIIKSSGRRGSGAPGSGDIGSDNILSREVFNKLSPAEKSSFFRKGGKLTD
jgi:hypothetical protein